MSTTKTALAATTALALLGAPLAVHAAAAPGKVDAGYDLSEIVVVAQRRSERLQDVPLSVTAIPARDLAAAGVGKSNELTIVTPGLQMASSGVSIQPVIRGIGSNVSSPSSESNVATYVDGAYQSSLVGSVFDLPDVESVQVLKGPQGTLFGRNATGGAILINTKAPNLTETEGTVSASYGNYNSVVVKGFITAPIIRDKLAFSLTALDDWTDGWKTNVATGKDNKANVRTYLVRGKLRFIPWEGADFTLSGMFSRRDDKSVTASPMYKGNNAFAPLAALFHLPPAVVASQPWTYSQDPAILHKQQTAFNLHGDIEFGPGKISTTTYLDRSPSVILTDVDNTSAPLAGAKIFGHPKTFSQELLYTTNQLGRWRAVGGVFYFASKVPNGVILTGPLFGGAVSNIYGIDKDRSYAGFGEITYDVTDQLSITGGLRYTHEKRISNAVRGLGAVQPATFFFPQDLTHTWSSWTPKVSALYKVTPHTNVYATYSRGFTGGAYNTTAFQQDPVNPEKVAAYEIGIKSNELKNLSFSIAAFYDDYTDLQTNHTVFVGGSPANLLGNAAKAKIKGVEVNGQWRATDSFDITAGANFMSAKYSSYPGAPVLIPNVTPAGIFGSTQAPTDISGSQMIRTPKFSGNVTAHYHLDIAQGGFDASATAYHSSTVFWDYGERIPQKPFTIFNGNLAFQPQGTKLRLSVWGKNLSNEKVLSSAAPSTNYDNVDYMPPRTYGVSVQYDF